LGRVELGLLLQCLVLCLDVSVLQQSMLPNCTENLIYAFPEMKLCGLVPKSYIHVSVSDFFIPRISLSIFGCRKIGRPILGIYKSLTDTVHECGNW
jgi:hypothetical protein